MWQKQSGGCTFGIQHDETRSDVMTKYVQYIYGTVWYIVRMYCYVYVEGDWPLAC